jgi:preprotein translocase subunit SecD
MAGIRSVAYLPAMLATGLLSMTGCAQDYKGGTEIVMQVQVQDAVATEADLAVGRLQEAAAKAGIKDPVIDRSAPASVEDASHIKILARGIPASLMPAIQTAIASDWSQSTGSPENVAEFALRPESFQRICREAGEQTVQSLQKRIEALGMGGVIQSRAGSNPPEIQLKLPRTADPSRVKAMLLLVADLRITPVTGGPFASPEDARASGGGALPVGTVLVESKGSSQWYLVSRVPVVIGRDVRDARAQQDEFKKWGVDFRLTQDAGQRLGRYTEANIGNRLAIVLDSRVFVVATIQSRIDQEAMVNNMGSSMEAQDIARCLKAGSLPGRVVLLSENIIH